MNKKKTETLADKISSILTSAPTNFDPEDVSDATTAPLVFDENEDVDYNEAEEEILSKFRKENIDLLADVDNKYAGKRASRKSLKDSDDDFSEGDDDPDEEDEEEEETNNSASEEGEDEANSYSEEDSESGSDDEDDEEDGFGDSSSIQNEENDPNFKHLNDADTSTQLKKAVCVRNQMSMWENLLEVRIQLQKSLITANKMPQKESFSRIKQELDPEFSTKLAETKQNLGGVLNKLLNLQELVLKQYPETKKLDSTANTKAPDAENDDDDEEIPSDTEPENSDSEEESANKRPAAKKRKLEDYEREIKEHHTKYKKYRDSVIQKWNDKARIAQKNNTHNSHSILHQIEYNLSNKEKLIKRTQFKRSQYEILGKEAEKDESAAANSPEECDSEIFDDDDFYHQLLRELIEVKSADLTDPVQLGRQWIQLQNLRSKMKRKIDTKATKGRKIRYAVHTKLVNFMAPIDEHAWTDEARTELYNSLFAKNQLVN